MCWGFINPRQANYNELENYDYYYAELLGGHSLGNLIESVTQVYPLRIGLKTGDTVFNWGFKLSWTTSMDAIEAEENQGKFFFESIEEELEVDREWNRSPKVRCD